MAKGLTQRELAKKAGIHHSHLALMEIRPDHEPRSQTKARLAEALGVSPGDLEGPSSTRRSWKAEFLADPNYSKETKRVIIQLVEAEEQRRARERRRK